MEELPPEELKGFNEAELEAGGFWGGKGWNWEEFHSVSPYVSPLFYSFLVPSEKLKRLEATSLLGRKDPKCPLFLEFHVSLLGV